MMKFSLSVTPGTEAPERVRRAEAAGFDSVIFVDSPMLFGDAYVSIAIAAARTERITLLPGVTNPVIRTAPITASILASLCAFAPGRIALGIGTGFTATGAMGLRSASLARLERYIDEVRGLLRGDVTEIEMGSRTIPMQFLNSQPPFIDLSHTVPVYMAASGPRALELAGRIADGVILGGVTHPGLFGACLDAIGRGAHEAGRDMSTIDVAIGPPVYLTTTDKPDFADLLEVLGPRSLGPSINSSRLAEQSERVPAELTEALVAVRDAYRPETEGEPRTRHLRAYRGYRSQLQPWQRALVTPAILDATCLFGTAEQCYRKLHELEACGVNRVILSPGPAQMNDVIDIFGVEVIPRLAS